MLFFEKQEAKGFTPVPGQRQPEGKFVVRNGRVLLAILAIVVIAVLWWLLSRNEHTGLADLTRTVGELLAGALVGAWLAEKNSASTINIYIDGKNTADQDLSKTQESLRIAHAELAKAKEAAPETREDDNPRSA